jgi:hypothetical protein
LVHRASHLASKGYEIRQGDNDADSDILGWTSELFEEHSLWRMRQVLLTADGLERQAQEKHGRRSQFLDYEPLSVDNAFYANLLNTWRALYIFIDLVTFPMIGPKGNGSRRFEYAVDICRVEGISQPWHSLAPTFGAKGQGSWISWHQVYRTVDSGSKEVAFV